MSRNAFPQLEKEYAESLALREHAAMERAQVPPLAAEIDSLRSEVDRLRRALARIAALPLELPTDCTSAIQKAQDIAVEALK